MVLIAIRALVIITTPPRRLLLQSELSLLEIRLTKHCAVVVCLRTSFLCRSVLLLLLGVWALLQAYLRLDEDQWIPRLFLIAEIVFSLDKDQALIGELLPLSLLAQTYGAAWLLSFLFRLAWLGLSFSVPSLTGREALAIAATMPPCKQRRIWRTQINKQRTSFYRCGDFRDCTRFLTC